MTRDSITWFEIPARDLDRAKAFYETVLQKTLRHETMGASRMEVFPAPEGAVAGCLMAVPADTPAAPLGTLVYLDAAPLLDAALERAVAAGGRVLLGRTPLPPGMGCFAHVADSEGNRIGLHAPG